MIGTSGSGKTTVARELAGRLGVPHVELDALHHGPDWYQPSAGEFRATVESALAPLAGWVVDGNYMRKLGTYVLERADTVVWLDLPLSTCLGRLWRRTSTRIRDGVELWNGNRESWRGALLGWDALFPWTVRAHLRRKREWPRRLAALEAELVRLRSPAEIAAWLEAAELAK